MAKIQAKWGKKRWYINSKKINPINALSLDMAYDTDEGTKSKRTISLPYELYSEMGMSVRKEVNQWYKRLGKSYPLYLGTKRFGAKKFKLTDVSVSDITVTQKGGIKSAAITLSFEEP